MPMINGRAGGQRVARRLRGLLRHFRSARQHVHLAACLAGEQSNRIELSVEWSNDCVLHAMKYEVVICDIQNLPSAFCIPKSNDQEAKNGLLVAVVVLAKINDIFGLAKNANFAQTRSFVSFASSGHFVANLSSSFVRWLQAKISILVTSSEAIIPLLLLVPAVTPTR